MRDTATASQVLACKELVVHGRIQTSWQVIAVIHDMHDAVIGASMGMQREHTGQENPTGDTQ